jgi:hypothetical protein
MTDLRTFAAPSAALPDHTFREQLLPTIAAERKALDAFDALDLWEQRVVLAEVASGARLVDVIADLPARRKARILEARSQ